jgi:hypothetical protein
VDFNIFLNIDLRLLKDQIEVKKSKEIRIGIYFIVRAKIISLREFFDVELKNKDLENR